MKNETVEIIVNGKPVKQYFFEGRWFVEARKGAQYEIKVKNNHYGRRLFVVSVDGLGVVDGKPATDDSLGYVLSGYSPYNIKGFRRSDEEVNKFEFSSKDQSYAVKSPAGEKSSTNCGVIAIRMWDEKEKPILYRRPVQVPIETPTPRIPPWRAEPFSTPRWKSSDVICSLADSGTSASEGVVRGLSLISLDTRSAAPESFDMGTKFSEEKVTDKVSTTEFEKGKFKGEINVYYASREALIAMGVPVEPEPVKVGFPKGFKSSSYCPEPE